MAQVITNTFFDDCEAIVNENGRVTIDAASVEFAAEYSEATFLKLGFSKRVFDDPKVLLGCYVKKKSKSNELIVQLNSYALSGSTVSVSGLTFSGGSMQMVIITKDLDKKIITFNIAS